MIFLIHLDKYSYVHEWEKYLKCNLIMESEKVSIICQGAHLCLEEKTGTNEYTGEETRWAKFVSINVREYHYEATFATSVYRRDMC